MNDNNPFKDNDDDNDGVPDNIDDDDDNDGIPDSQETSAISGTKVSFNCDICDGNTNLFLVSNSSRRRKRFQATM